MCCDGLGKLNEAIEATWPKAIVKTCVIHHDRARCGTSPTTTAKKVATALRPDLHRRQRGRRQRRARAAARSARQALPRPAGRLGPRPGAVHPVRGIRHRDPQGDLHHQRHRVHQLPAAEDHQEPRALPRRRRRGSSSSTSASATSPAAISTASAFTLERGERVDGTLGWNGALDSLAVRFGDRLPGLTRNYPQSPALRKEVAPLTQKT